MDQLPVIRLLVDCIFTFYKSHPKGPITPILLLLISAFLATERFHPWSYCSLTFANGMLRNGLGYALGVFARSFWRFRYDIHILVWLGELSHSSYDESIAFSTFQHAFIIVSLGHSEPTQTLSGQTERPSTAVKEYFAGMWFFLL